MAFDAKDFITKSRAQDIADDVIYKYLQDKGLVSGGTPGAPGSAPDASTGNLQGTMTNNTPTPQSGGVFSKIGGFVGDVAKSIVKPVVQTVAAPFQAIKSAVDYAKDPLAPSKTDFNLPWLGKIEAPTSIKQQVGRSLETVGVGLGPVAGGAALGAGAALDEGKSLGQAALQASLGALGGKVLDYGVGKLGSGLTKLGNMTSEGIGKVLEKSSLPLTVAEKGKMSTQLNRAADFLFNYGIKGDNVARYDTVKGLGDKFETTLQDFLDKNNTKIAPVSKSQLISELTKLKGKLMKDSSVAPEVEKQINSAIDNLSSQYRNEKIPIARLNVLKRSTYDNAYAKAGDKVLDWVEHDIGDVYKTAIEKATKGLEIEGPNGVKQAVGDFNKEYGDLLNAKKILKVVTANGTNERQVTKGLSSKLLPRLVGSLIGGGIGYEKGGTLGAAEGAVVGGIGSAYLPALLETIAGANSRSQLAGALKYLSEHSADLGLNKVSQPVQKLLKSVGETVKATPTAVTNIPRTPIAGTPDILPLGITNTLRSKFKLKGLK